MAICAFGPSGLNLKPKQIAGVLTYIRQEWGNAGSEITEETMKNYMAMYNARTSPADFGRTVVDLSPEPGPHPWNQIQKQAMKIIY